MPAILTVVMFVLHLSGEFFIIDGGSKMCLDTPKKNESRKEWSCESERLKSTTTTVVSSPTKRYLVVVSRRCRLSKPLDFHTSVNRKDY